MTEEHDGKNAKAALINILSEEKSRRSLILEGAKMARESAEDLEQLFALGDTLSDILKEMDVEGLMRTDGDLIIKGKHIGLNGLLVLMVRAISDPVLLSYLMMAVHQAVGMYTMQSMPQHSEKEDCPQEEQGIQEDVNPEASNGKGESIVEEFEQAQKEGKIH